MLSNFHVELRMRGLLIAVLCFSFVSTLQGRPVQILSYQEMFDRADLVAIALPTAVRDTTERTVIPHLSPPNPAIGIETEFLVQTLIKGGNSPGNRIVLHHYRHADPAVKYRNGPDLVLFNLENQEPYLLFLKKEADGRFAPINGQTDPGLCGFFPAKRIDLIVIAKPISAKEQIETGVLPNGRPRVHIIGYWTEFELHKVIKGEISTNRLALYHKERVGQDGRKKDTPYPLRINFEPDKDWLYLLFLRRKEADGSFEPLARRESPDEQTTPAGFSVIRLERFKP